MVECRSVNYPFSSLRHWRTGPDMSSETSLNAFRLFIAAFGALLAAHLLGLTNPYWAAMPVFVVAQPFREDILIRGALRILGTIVGAIIGFVTIHFLHEPWLVGAILVLTVASGAALAYWIGTIYSYGAMIAGLTCAVIVVPAFGGHAEPFQLAMDRFWCTLLGVVAVTLSTFLFTPRRAHKHPLRLDHSLTATAGRFITSGTLVLLGFVGLIYIGGFLGIGFALALSIFPAVMGSMPNPAPMLKYMPAGAAIGVILGLIYRYIGGSFGLDQTSMVILAGIFIAIGSMLRAHPRTAPFGLDTNMIFLLSAEVGLPGHSLLLLAEGGAVLLAAGLIATTVYRYVLKIPALTPRS